MENKKGLWEMVWRGEMYDTKIYEKLHFLLCWISEKSLYEKFCLANVDDKNKQV